MASDFAMIILKKIILSLPFCIHNLISIDSKSLKIFSLSFP